MNYRSLVWMMLMAFVVVPHLLFGSEPAGGAGMQTRIFKFTLEMSEVMQKYLPERLPEAPPLKNKEVLTMMGIPFPEGADVITRGLTANQVIVRNKPENLALIQQFVDAVQAESEGRGEAITLAPMIKRLSHVDEASSNVKGIGFRSLAMGIVLVLGLGAVCFIRSRSGRGARDRSGPTFKSSASLVLLTVLSPLTLGHIVSAAEPDPATHTVIVPYDATKPPAEQKAQRLYLPYDSFQKLWQQAKLNRRPEVLPPDDHAFHILSALHEVRVEDRGLVIESKIEAVLRGHWTRLPLPYLSGKTPLLVGEVQVDGKAAALNDGAVVLEDPGLHHVHLTATLALERDWKKAELTVPAAVAALLAVQTLKSDGWLRINGAPASGVEETDAGRVFTSGLGTQDQIVLERSARGLNRGEGPVMAARSNAALYLKEHQRDQMSTSIIYEFPGSTRRYVSFKLDAATQQLYTLRANVPGTQEQVPVESIAMSSEGTLRRYEVILSREVTDQVELYLSAYVTGNGQAMTAPQPEAQRLQETLSINHDQTLEVKAQPKATQRRVNMNAGNGLTTLAYEQSTHAPLVYTVTKRKQLTKASVDYVFQLSPQKIELIAALALERRIGDWTNARISLPAGGYEVQSVAGPALVAWQHEGGELFLHLNPTLARRDARLVVHLARTVAQPATSWTLEPLGLTEFEKISGRVLITAHAASEVRLPALTAGLKEVDATVLDSVIAIAPPLEKKRAVEFEGNAWKLEVPLTPQPARFVAEGVALVLVSDSGVRLSQQIGLQVTQGALRQAVVRLPASLPEAVVTGSQLRELRSRVEGAVRIYECTFQSDILDRAELTFDHDLPLGATLDVPFANVDAAERMTRYFVTDNESAREASVAQKTAIESVSKEAMPYLPANLARPQFYRSTGAGALRLAFQQLTATEANAALVTLAEITTVLRPDGERWDTITYSLLNRTLQFLPVKLSSSSELMSASVNGEPVRADEEKRADGVVKLIPLIQTKPGQRSLEVRLVCRFKRSEQDARPSFDDPELPGLSIERTTWTVWTPKGMVINDFDGNMEEVDAEGLDLQKLEGMLSELGDVNRELASGKLGYSDAKDAYSRASSLADQVAAAKQQVISKAEKIGSRLLSKERYARKPSSSDDRGYASQDEMDQEVTKQRDLLSKNWAGYEGKAAKPESSGKPAAIKPKTDWNANYLEKTGDGDLKSNNTFTGNSLTLNGGAVLNDNVAVSNDFFNGRLGNEPMKAAESDGSIMLNRGQSLVMNGSNAINIGNARANSLSNAAPNVQGEVMEHKVNQKKRMVAEESAARAPKAAPAPAAPAASRVAGAIAGARMDSTADPFGAAPAPVMSPSIVGLGNVATPAPLGGLPGLPAAAAPPPPPLEMEFQRQPAQTNMAIDPFADSIVSASGSVTFLPGGGQALAITSGGRLTQAQTAEFLRATGRRSLLVEVPADGEVRHFTKLKDHAVLDLDIDRTWQPGTKSNLIWLAVALAAWGLSMRWKRFA